MGANTAREDAKVTVTFRHCFPEEDVLALVRSCARVNQPSLGPLGVTVERHHGDEHSVRLTPGRRFRPVLARGQSAHDTVRAAFASLRLGLRVRAASP